MSLNLEHLHRVHCVGVGGIGVSAVAKLLRLQGKEVTGSDLHRSEVTADAEKAGVTVLDESEENVRPDLDLIVYTAAAPETHVERAAAARLGIPQLEYFEFLGLLSQAYETVAVCGTNGKSTTTAMLGLMLEAAGFDPLVIVGSRVTSFPYGNLRLPSNLKPQSSKLLFVVEACEYRAHMLHLSPSHIAVTNVTEDHLDYYRDIEHIRETFQRFVDAMPETGTLVLNADDPVSGRLMPKGKTKRFAVARDADYRAEEIAVKDERQRFRVARKDPPETWDAELRVPGRFNIENALAAAAMARELGVPSDVIVRTLASFPGIWRRFERVGATEGGADIISDYGHHPDAVRATLEAAKEFFPDRRLMLVFQPHQHDRTRKLFDAFVESFDAADVLILAEIYGVAGRTEDADVSSNDLLKAVEARDMARGRTRETAYAVDPAAARAEAAARLRPDDVVIVMGAGDIYRIAHDLVRDEVKS